MQPGWDWMDNPEKTDWRFHADGDRAFRSEFGAEDEVPYNLLANHMPWHTLPEPLNSSGGVFPLHGSFEGTSICVIPNAPPGVDPIYIMSDYGDVSYAWLNTEQRDAIAQTCYEQLITQEGMTLGSDQARMMADLTDEGFAEDEESSLSRNGTEMAAMMPDG